MKRVVLNALLALVLMILQTGVSSSFGLESVCHFTVIAAVLSGALSLPMISSTVSILLLGVVCDMWLSGVSGLTPLLLMIVYLGVRAAMLPFRSERVLAVMVYGILASIAYDALCALAYGVFYRSMTFFSIFGRVFWCDALWAAIWTPLVMWMVMFLDRVTSRKRKSGLS